MQSRNERIKGLAPGLTVVVIGRNEGQRLRACLKSVYRMTCPSGSFEVVYVDSGSGDGSAELAEEMGARVIRLTEGRWTAARARNAGWRASGADFILFLDGDTLIDPSFVECEIHQFFDSSVAAVFGQRREVDPNSSIYNRILDLDWNPSPGRALYFGGDALVRRVSLDAVGGYREDLIAGEEPELCRRLRAHSWHILHVQRPMTLHDLALTSWRQYWRRAVRTGHAYAEISGLFARTRDPLWRKESRLNVLRGLFWILLPLAALLLSFRLSSGWPVGVALLSSLLLVGRSAFRNRHKTHSLITLALYGVHSHLQQIPILTGQLNYWTGRASSRPSDLIEYKQPAA